MVFSHSEDDEQQSSGTRAADENEANLAFGVQLVCQNLFIRIKEHLLAFLIGDSVSDQIFVAVVLIPVKSHYVVEHLHTATVYTKLHIVKCGIVGSAHKAAQN